MKAAVVFNLPIDHPFTYRVPTTLSERAVIGTRVRVPFGPRRLTGFIVDLPARAPAAAELKAIDACLDAEPVLTPELLALGRWLSRRYCCSWGEALAAIMPTALRPSVRQRAPAEGKAAVATLPPDERQQAFNEQLRHALTAHNGRSRPVLGWHAPHRLLTPSCAELWHEAAGADGAVMVLVPEIGWIDAVAEACERRWPGQVSRWHSSLAPTQRYAAWRRLRRGEDRVVVGTRSAVFLPLPHLRLIVMEQEQDGAYKQDETPRYHARDVALERARLAVARLVLASHAPSLEAYAAARRERWPVVTATASKPPRMELVDLREESRRQRRRVVLSVRLEEALRQTLERGERAILMINRRGFASFIHCRGCGYTARCVHCDVTLTYHAQERQLVCHYCGARQPAAELCPQCRQRYLQYQAGGTERLVSEVARLFPTAVVARWDADTRRRSPATQSLERAQVLIGTQLLAKPGMSLPQVSLVGVVSADAALHQPDFRAAERTMALLTSLAGLAGAGRLFIQSYHPRHPALQALRTGTLEEFYRQELALRAQWHLPPAVHLVTMTLRARSAARAERAAAAVARRCKRLFGKTLVDVLGPVAAPRLRGYARQEVHVKLTASPADSKPVAAALAAIRRRHGTHVVVDVDPY